MYAPYAGSWRKSPVTSTLERAGGSVSFKAQWYRDKLAKKRQKAFRGYPVATVAYYG